MKIEIAEHGRMTESGSSLLRLIQNQDMPLLDLLVRESVQNSLDAAKKDTSFVNVDFRTGKFNARMLNKHFDQIEKPLNGRFPSVRGDYDYIAICDSNTNGLTGPVRYDDVKENNFGNLLKLVYEICKPQQNEGAGGSWGLGKTIYFRVGIGLVIYYSRILQDGKYTSRLAACLVEDETKNNCLIPYKGGVKRGIAWWGKSDGISSKHTVPIENDKEIMQVLTIFGIKPFGEKETGTMIIIPYVNTDKLLNEVYAKNEEESQKPYWTKSVQEYLNVAIQRWYAPRIENKKYKYGAYLSPAVNGNKIATNNMLPLFRVIRELYIFSNGNELDKDALLSGESSKPVREDINLRGVFGKSSTSGIFTFIKLDTAQLKMLPPDNNKNPYQQITNRCIPMESGNIPIVMYTRKPGLIVGYDYDGPWTHRMPKSLENEFIIGIFVLNSENQLKETRPNHKPVSLEEYIRQGEKADHASWSDRNIGGNNYRIVFNIQRNVIRKISSKFNEKLVDTTEKKNIGLGHALADILLPTADFGHVSNSPEKPETDSKEKSTSAKRKSSFAVTSEPTYKNGSISYNFEIYMKTKVCILNLLVVTDYKKINSASWEDEAEIGRPFPLSFDNFSVVSSRINSKGSMENSVNLYLSDETITAIDGDYTLSMISSDRFGVMSAVKIECAKDNTIIKGILSFHTGEPSLKGIFELKEM